MSSDGKKRFDWERAPHSIDSIRQDVGSKTEIDADTAPTTDQMRADVNRRSGKLDDGAPEPAASPLGTDNEAAGTPATGDRIAMAQEADRKIAEAAKRKADGRG